MSTSKHTLNWYDRNAESYARHLGTDEGLFHFGLEKPAMYAQVPDIKDKSVLSLGCGPGQDSAYLKSQGAKRSVGIDISSQLITIAKKEHPDCEFQVMDMEKLDFDEGEFDFVYSSLALHYLPDWRQVLSQVYRVLKPEGEFLFSVGHPVTTAIYQSSNGNVKEIYLGAKINKQTHEVELFGEYLNPKTMEGSHDMKVVYYHRPLQAILKEIIASGFNLKDFLEPKPNQKMKSVSPRHYQLYSTLPWVMIIKLTKP